MKIKLLILLLLPIAVTAQEVQPVVSPDYIDLIKNNATVSRSVDTTNSLNRSPLRYTVYNFPGPYYSIKEISTKGNVIKLHPLLHEALYISGSVAATIALRRFNQMPLLQQQYAQGRSVNGNLKWQGPHTNELFSYGPAINSLEFDGTNYPYDINGQLVAAGTGNGRNAIIYTPSIFRTAALFTNTVTMQATYKKNYQQVVRLLINAGQSGENSGIIFNKNKADNFSALVEGNIKSFTITGSYNYKQERFSNNNRTGFLNRVYQNALLSPVSFDNSQGNTVGNLQRSYSLYADNPLFLLEDNGHAFLEQQYSGNIDIEKRMRRGKVKLSQAYEKLQQYSNEGYKPGMAFFENGMQVNRATSSSNYFLIANGEYNIPLDNYYFRANLTANYIFANNKAVITYAHNNTAYNYQRSSHDAAFGFSSTYGQNAVEAGLTLQNKIYISNTATKNNFFLPSVSGYARFSDIFQTGIMARLKGTVTRFNSELPISRSFAQNASVQYNAGNAMQYLPVTEVTSFNNLSPLEHQEYTSGIEFSYKNRARLSFEYFNRNTNNDIFPVMNNGQIQLANIADHRNRGIELGAEFNSYYIRKSKIMLLNALSFTTYQSKVTGVKNNYNYTPIAGFKDVHKAVVLNAPLGAIVGNSFLKDVNNNIIIGTDGFPLVNNTPTVIGNPAPDFIVKMTNSLKWKDWGFNIDWEWRKGGDMWNGTAALLDYYGRSENSASLRNTTNYVFAGVDINGKPNTIPVNFYDPSLPVEQNRWARYGQTGVASDYIQKADCIKLNNIALTYKLVTKKYLQQVDLTLYAANIILWSAYKGADPNQLLNDQSGTGGLDFFNIPSYRSFGFTVSLKF